MTKQELETLHQELMEGQTIFVDVPKDRQQYYVVPTVLNRKFNENRKEPLWEMYTPLKNKGWYRVGMLNIKFEREILEVSCNVFGQRVITRVDTDWLKRIDTPENWNKDFDEGSEPEWKK